MGSYLRIAETTAKREQQREDTRRREHDTRVQSGCTGKETFATWTEAQRVARRFGRFKDAALEPYACRHCHKFHVAECKPKEARRRT